MKGMNEMIDVGIFLLLLIYLLCCVLLVTLIVLVVKLINTVNRLNGVIDEVSTKIAKFDKAFRLVDILADNMALISDKLVDGLSYVIRKIFYKKDNRKDEESYE